MQIETVKAQIATNDGAIRKYEADINLWRAAYASAMERVRAVAQLYGSDADIYRANIGKAEAEGRLHVEQEAIISRNIDAQAQLALEALRTNLTAFVQVVGLKKEAAEGGAKVAVTKLAALMNSFSTVVQLAASGVTTATENKTTS
ncbi:MAG: hypothetical protein M1497_15410 [Nitrospirae bacterium]|nr:hypothetical protein [Nitrospirota bacterium]